ncbi:MAG: RNA polymerase subunit sigma-70 [Flavobacteriaceae bacterium]|nr:MAG: RNA polymerase subunit sigma-70 [Flavobacteriaceae bacterium]
MDPTIIKHLKIIELCKQHNAKAQMQLYDLYCNAMFNVALRYVQNSQDAEDVMQDAFVKVFKKLHMYHGEVSVGAWIKKIVINQSIDYLKKKSLNIVQLDAYENTIPVVDDNWDVAPEISKEQIVTSLYKLKEKYMIILSLYLFEGYDHKEISEILSISEVSSRSQLHRGKKQLKILLKPYLYAK